MRGNIVMDSVIGHAAQKRALLANSSAVTWLLCGRRGIGKSRLSRAFAKHVTGSVELESDPDVMLIDNATEPISVDKVREMRHFLHMTAIRSKRKVVIVDSIDDLSVSPTNAMLKTLEEPPAGSLILLISHNVHRVPVVVKSRCVILPLHELSHEETKLVIDRNFPDMQQLSDKITRIYPGIPGMVTEDIEKEILLYENLISVIHKINPSVIGSILETDLPLHKVEYIVLRAISDIICDAVNAGTKDEQRDDCTVTDMLGRYHKAQEIFRAARTMRLQRDVTIFRVLEIATNSASIG
ncbi:DNA polymerase III subunit gamma [Anaplasma marginale str. Gypsy Plains]|nr:DNA polymerase III subunit gamma [Anaplasma marginale str. Gypsy Plains]